MKKLRKLLLFLAAVQTGTGFSLARRERERQAMREVARRRASDRGGIEVFEINSAFHWILQIQEG
jgi:hypothetical protein